ncbi:DNA segregation ATPase FtsK/SpoIIIE [Paenibacillus sp. FSL R7-269]|uniref:FtsK/SpoIIIE domain-containing protein n=1 Tax=Paenibacillus sp. FSL R7-269 TaxID=1226755 RepID=UPI0003E2A7E0|nr:FtsK/SpoIIIE domain-containing protein [Paenibacillus sp. FSL R7-269]ETT53139.1 DNA segregation ATPase FtsK/SpoIIIE [Paenibacillus sp. FSL R7-269]
MRLLKRARAKAKNILITSCRGLAFISPPVKNAAAWWRYDDQERLRKATIAVWLEKTKDDLQAAYNLLNEFAGKAFFERDTPQGRIDQAVRLILRYDTLRLPYTSLGFHLAFLLGLKAPLLRRRFLWLLGSVSMASLTVMLLHVFSWFPFDWFPIGLIAVVFLILICTYKGYKLLPVIRTVTADHIAAEHLYYANLAQLHQQAKTLLLSKRLKEVAQIQSVLHAVSYQKHQAESSYKQIPNQFGCLEAKEVHTGSIESTFANANYLDAVWKKFIEQHFSKASYITPEYIKEESTELHVFRIAGIPASEFSKREAIVESLVRKRVYRVHSNYQEVGVTAIELITTQLPLFVTYKETPTPKERNLVILGRDVKQKIYWDYYDQPHLLVVGITKSGKSATVNNIIRQMKEKDVLMLFVDFKNGLEYAPYYSKGYSVIEEVDQYPDFSTKLVKEMSIRAEFLKKHGFKNFEGYEALRDQQGLPSLPRIVCFIDEVATVMGHSDPNIQKPSIQNTELLLQKARASGIHMILSTQRPDARSLGSTGIRDNIAVKMSSYLSIQASTLIYGDDRANQRIPDQGYAGIFIASGLGTDAPFRVPFMDDTTFSEYLATWPDNSYSNYKIGNSVVAQEEVSVIDQFDYNQIF